jgi:hypothetical protein
MKKVASNGRYGGISIFPETLPKNTFGHIHHFYPFKPKTPSGIDVWNIAPAPL